MLQPRTGIQRVYGSYNGHIGTCSLFIVISGEDNAEHALIVVFYSIREAFLIEFADEVFGTFVSDGACHYNTIALYFKW